MTPAQQAYIARLRGIRAPKRASIGVSLGATGAAGGAPITADQGPLPDGGNLGQQSLPQASGRVPGANRFTIGNASRGNIDLGSFTSARPNKDALAQLAADPLANVDPYQATSGVGGFFRRLFGDNANELNALAAADRGELARKKWAIDLANQGQMGVLDKQHQLALALEDKRNQFQKERDAAQAEYGMQGRRYDAATDLSRDINRAFDDLLKDTRQQNFTASENRLNRASNEDIAGGRNEAMQLRYLLSQAGRGGGMDGFKVPPSLGYDPLSDSYTRWNDIDGKFETIPRMGGQAPAPGGTTGVVPTKELNDQTVALTAAAAQQQGIDELTAPPSALGGLMSTPIAEQYKRTLQYSPPGMIARGIGSAVSAGSNQLKTLLNYLREQDRINRVKLITPTE